MRWRPGRIARNTAHASSWNGIRIVLQAAGLVLMARVLGANGYGALAGSVALFMVCGQFTGLGSGVALVRHVARGGELRGRFAATEYAYLLSGLVLTALALPPSLGLLGEQVPPTALAWLAIAEILIAPTLFPLVYRYQAEERMFLSSAIGTLAPMARLVTIAAVAMLGLRDITVFAQLYLACLILTATITLYLAWPRGDPVATCSTWQTIREGLPYAVSGVALTAGTELDKTVLLRLAGDAVTGPYAAAYRIASAATLPINALILAASPRLFRAPSANNTRLATTMLAVVFGYAMLAAAALWLFAPFAPWLLGRGFDNATPLLRALCIIIITSSLRQYITALLTTRDRQVSRNMIEIGGACISLVALLVLVPSFGAYGAILAIALSDLCVATIGTISHMHKRTQERKPNLMKNLLRRAIEYSGPGQWIYTKKVLAWTNDITLVNQLPRDLRMFCKYTSAYNKYIGTKTVLFAHKIYKTLKISRKNSEETRLEINGTPVWLDLTDPGSLNAISEIYNGSNVSEEIKALCKDVDAFVDVGANQGAMTAIASKILPPNATLIAIEPQRNLAACIEKTLKEHRPDGNWHVVQAAVGHYLSTAQIIVPQENFGEAHLSVTHGQPAQSTNMIPVTTLDNMLVHIEPEDSVVVKMDIEGYEMDALLGSREFISKCKPIIIMEINSVVMSRYRHTISELGKLLHELGYYYWRECGSEYEYKPIGSLPERYCDVVLYMNKPTQQ